MDVAFTKTVDSCVCAVEYGKCLKDLTAFQKDVLGKLATWERISEVVVPVGFGQTTLSLLAPIAAGSRQAILIIEPAEWSWVEHQHRRLRQHFRVPTIVHFSSTREAYSYVIPGEPVLMVMSSVALSRCSDETIASIDPDLVIVSDPHYREHLSKKSLTRYLLEHERVRIVAWKPSVRGE